MGPAEKPVRSKSQEGFPGISPEEREKYIGKHIVIAGEEIIAIARGAREAWEKARKKCGEKELELRYVCSRNLLAKCRCFERRRP